jgi:hypothetical protein
MKSKNILKAYKKEVKIAPTLMPTASLVNFFTINAFMTNAKNGRRTIGATVPIV